MPITDEFPRFEIHERSRDKGMWRIIAVFYNEDATQAVVELFSATHGDDCEYRMVKVFGPVTF